MKSSFSIMYIALIITSISLVSCGEGGPSKGPAAGNLIAKKDSVVKVKRADTVKPVVKKQIQDTVSFDRKYNDVARFIAGMKQEPGSKFTALEKDTVWIRRAKISDKAWDQLNSKRLKQMSDWAVTELATQRSMNLDIFYPLSGPDILHANAFFPHANKYHLYALERAGSLPDIEHMKTKGIDTYLEDVYTSLGDIFTKSYFITHKMLTDLQRENVNGTLPLMCVFLVRTNHKIINVKYFHLNDDGTETQLDKDSIAKHTNDFVKVYFKGNNDSNIQQVTYMKCDLADGGLKENKGLVAFMKNMPTSVTYLKSASYLLHYKFFTTLRDAILDKSQTILEDDTGIPYKYFPKDKWNLSLYGTYVKPVDNFSGVFQEDLQKAYKDSLEQKPKKLPFSLGYHWGTNDQNLIKAEHKS
jgi:hypothetical protein